MTSAWLPPSLFLGLLQLCLVPRDALSCGVNGPATYSLSFSAEWTPNSFPKHYPTHRPPAQWSSLFGCIHNLDFVLWANGSLVSPGVRMFVELGKPQLLIEEMGLAEDKVWSWFQADPIQSGEGNTTTTISMNSSHPLVSVIVRMVPSPDWFVGVSSLNLCENGQWTRGEKCDLFPWDAGTDSGFTFSSPNFETHPQEKVSQITATNPSHPANSFYYPRIQNLPRLGHLEFNLFLAETNNATWNGVESSPVDTEKIVVKCVFKEENHQHSNDTGQSQQMGNASEEEFKIPVMVKDHCGTMNQSDFQLDLRGLPSSNHNSSHLTEEAQNETSEFTRGRIVTPLDCEVSHWLSWGLCSQSCGSGIRQRTRYITLQPANDGDPCPPLLEREMCEQPPCSTYQPSTTESASTTHAPGKKMLSLKWKPSQSKPGVLWRSIYQKLLGHAKGLKNTTRELHPVLLHST
ncbi:spondin-2-like [Ambystoma mexicanum]|uniref:spondin-2-like n=1 Tax=Ambystoma mexicanum TaxID=8296 RepID=UPI0037E8B824